MYRVKVRFPWLNDQDESHWARVASLMAGNGRGWYTLPEVDDEVLVAFEHGSIDHPYVIGALWNGKDAPPDDNADGQNNRRSFTSRCGHVVRLDDSSGREKVEVIDKTGSNRIVIDTSARRIRIEADGDIEITSSTGTVKISGMAIELQAQTSVKMQAQTTVDINATTMASIQGGLVKIN